MKDALGNELKVGDMVAIQLARPLIFGQVVEATDSALITAAHTAQLVAPGRIVVMSRHVIEFDPRVQIEAVLALRNEQGHQAIVGVEERPLPN